MSKLYQGLGVALNGVANEIVRVSEASGPMFVIVNNKGLVNIMPMVIRKSDSARVAFNDEVAVTGDNTPAYTGNAALIDFTTGLLATARFIVPGSLTMVLAVAGTGSNARDYYGDGKLYTVDVDLDECGTINYFTGAVDLHFPAGKVPGAGIITGSYSYFAHPVVPNGIVTYPVGILPPEDTYILKAAASAGNSQVNLDVVVTY